MNLRWTSVGLNLCHLAAQPTGNCVSYGKWDVQFIPDAVHIVTWLPAVTVVSHSVSRQMLAQCRSVFCLNCCLLLLAATLLHVQAVTWVGSITTTNIPTKSGNQQLSDTIMTPHLQVEHPSLNPLSFQLTVCLTQLYTVCSVESAVLINTSFCYFTVVCGTVYWIACCVDCCRIYQAVGHLPQLLWSLAAYENCPALGCLFIERLMDLPGDMQHFSGWWSQHWTWIRWTMGSSWSNAALMMTCKVWT